MNERHEQLWAKYDKLLAEDGECFMVERDDLQYMLDALERLGDAVAREQKAKQ